MKVTLVICSLVLAASVVGGNPVPAQGRDKTVLSKADFFDDEFVVYTGNHTIVNLVFTLDGTLGEGDDSGKQPVPLIFFNQVDVGPDGRRSELGQYVLVNRTAHKVFDGRASTTDLGRSAVYFASEEGLYVYNAQTRGADKFGDVTDSVLQLRSANGTGELFILTEPDYRIHKVDAHGTGKTMVGAIPRATDFVLDRANNIYYHAEDGVPYVLTTDAAAPIRFPGFADVRRPMLIRPAVLFPDSVLFMVDGDLLLLYANGTSEDSTFQFKELPSAVALDAAVIQYYALDGSIYEYNLLEIVLRAIFGRMQTWFEEVQGKLTSFVDRSKIDTNSILDEA